MTWWEAYIPEHDREIYRLANFGGPSQGGQHPALLIVDALWAFIGHRPVDIFEAIQEYPTACGRAGWEGMGHIAEALATCRRLEIPVVYVCATANRGEQMGLTTRRARPEPMPDAEAYQIPEAIAPGSGEPVITKTKASAFFRTPLDVLLRRAGVDTLLIAGSTTCGCIRATAVEAHSLGFHTWILEDAVWDRSPFSHAVALFELHMKYAHVVTVAEAMAELAKRVEMPASGGNPKV